MSGTLWTDLLDVLTAIRFLMLAVPPFLFYQLFPISGYENLYSPQMVEFGNNE